MRKIIGVITLLAVIICCASCGNVPELWTDATYLENATVGEGEKQFTVEITTDQKSITLTVKTNETILGEALYNLELINDPTFFDVINGIKADWNKYSAYWMFKKNGEYMNYGVGDEIIENGANYQFVYTK